MYFFAYLVIHELYPMQSISRDQAKRFSKFRERKGIIDKDVVCNYALHLISHLLDIVPTLLDSTEL